MNLERASWVLVVMAVACTRSSPDSSSDREASVAPLASVAPANAEPWNPRGIDWQPFDEGLALAKQQNKHVCLVLFTTWCPHCKSYSRVFGDPRLVERAKDFVMIRVNADDNDVVARRYRPDGGYVPRTFILDADGNIDAEAVSGNPRYKYFFDESHADSLLHAMNTVR